MDNKKNTSNNSSVDISQELAHVTQEMYKKNLELAEKNKTLALLQRIEEIILGSLTDVKQIAEQVTKAMVDEADFRSVAIFLYSKSSSNFLTLAVSQSKNKNKETNLLEILPKTKISLDSKNIFYKAYSSLKKQITYDLKDVLVPSLNKDLVEKIQQENEIKTIIVYPLILHGEILGMMMINLSEMDQHLFEYREDLIDRLPGIIEITINNALLYRRIQNANTRLKEVDRLKDEFLSIASHELRTPMTAIKSYLWLALSGKGGELSEKMKFYLERSYNSTERLIKLVNDLLSISRIESGRVHVELQKTDAEKIIDDTIIEVLPRANELGLNVEFLPHKELPPVLADPDKIKEVLMNLIGNSLKFTPKGGNIQIKVEIKDQMLIVSVVDNGQGLAPDDIPKLFQKFNIIKGSYEVNHNIFQGTGLGLFICKKIIGLHNGEIWVTSEGKGKGSTFSFSLNLAK